MINIAEHKKGDFDTGGSFYIFSQKELRHIGASQFIDGDKIRVSKYYIYIKYGGYGTPLASWVENANTYKPLYCMGGNGNNCTPYYIAEFKGR